MLAFLKRILLKIDDLSGENLREKSFADQNESALRGLIMSLSFIIMIFIIIGLLSYRITNPGTVFTSLTLGWSEKYAQNSSSQDFSFLDETNELFVRKQKGTLTGLDCTCENSVYVEQLHPSLIEQDGKEMEKSCKEVVKSQLSSFDQSLSNTFIGFCDKISDQLLSSWFTKQIGSSQLLSKDDIASSIKLTFEKSCSDFVQADAKQFQKNFILYSTAIGTDPSKIEKITNIGTSFLRGLFNFGEKGCVYSTYESSTTRIQTDQFYANYLSTCSPSTCRYSEDESTLDSILWCAGIFATAWGIVVLVAAILYALLLKMFKKKNKVSNLQSLDL